MSREVRRRRAGQRVSSEAKLAFLRSRANYAQRTRRVTVAETHYAWVFLTDRCAYKLKKPLRFGRLDYRSLASRRRGCMAELLLNRRLAPAVYQAVVPLSVNADGRLVLGPGRYTVDWLVRMRRLPAAQLLDDILRRRELRSEELRRLTDRLRRFFMHQAKRCPQSRRAYVARFRREMVASCRALCRADDALRLPARRLCRQQLLFVSTHGRELAARGGQAVDGHGDLKPEHVWLGRPLQIIDCLEFDRRLRRFDPLEELALLAVEMERFGRARSAAALPAAYQRRGQRLPELLWQFYLSQRATTRAKLAAWHIGDPQFPDARPWRRRALQYLQLAQAHIDQACAVADYVNKGVTGSPPSMRRSASANSGATANSVSL